MGNGESRSLAAARLRRPLAVNGVKNLSEVSWDEFAAYVRSVNAKCRGLINEQGEYFIFGARHGADGDEEWKDHLIMICVARHVKTCQNRFVRSYTLQRFINLYHSLAMIPECNTPTLPPSDLTDSIFDCDTASTLKAADTRSLDEKSCCICFDREADTILSCTHSFCTVCVATWSEYRTTFQCPLCKATIQSPITDSWELTSEKPTKAEMEGYFTSQITARSEQTP